LEVVEVARDKKVIFDKSKLNSLLSFGFLSQLCPKSIIDDILSKLGKASQRIRMFPAVAVVYFVITMSLWRDAPLEEVLSLLVENFNWIHDGKEKVVCPGKASISRARTKLGVEPMRQIAERILRPIAPNDFEGAWYKGMRLMAFDGSCFDLPDEKGNANHFGYPGSSRGESAFPQARVLSLVETGTHIVVAAEIGPCRRSEKEMAMAIIEAKKLGKDMLLLADRGFYGYELWSKAVSAGVNLLWRIKANLQLPVEERLSDGSYLTRVYDSRNRSGCKPYQVRVIEYKLTDKQKKCADEQVGVEIYRIITNLLDPVLTPACELAQLYHERWEIETLFGELKKTLHSSCSMIRSKTPILVEQEIWGLIIIHFAIRQIMAMAAFDRGIDPDKLSFKRSYHVLRRKLPQSAAFPPCEKVESTGEGELDE
jgi:hypothetical protein